MSYPPSGITDDPEIPMASSVTDYIFKRLAKDYLSFDDRLEIGMEHITLDANTDSEHQPDDMRASLDSDSLMETEEVNKDQPSLRLETDELTDRKEALASMDNNSNGAPLCSACGFQTQRSGSCYACPACGMTTGCG